MQAVQFTFLRMLAGRVRKSTCKQLLLREFGCCPLVAIWFTACWDLWHRAVDRPLDDWLFLALQENRDLSLRAYSSSSQKRVQQSLWFWQMREFVRMLHSQSGMLAHVGDSLAGLQCLEQEDMSSVRDAFHGWLYQRWHNLPSNPRVAGHDTVMHSTYESWFADAPFEDLDLCCPASWCPAYVLDTAGIHKPHLASLMRFRLGAHNLRVATGRWERVHGSSLPRAQRLCHVCTSGRVEDEFHLVFECDAYSGVRERCWRLFRDFGDWESPVAHPSGRDLARFMQQRQPLVAAFIHYCFLARGDPEMTDDILPYAVSVSETDSDSSELVEVSS
jgi:hypothetical protein